MANDRPEIERAREHALRLLERRARSRVELEAALYKKGFGEAAIAGVLDDCARLGYLNDCALAEDTVRSLLRKEPAARPLLEQRLASRGVEEPVAERAIASALTGRSPFDDALALVQRRLRSMPAGLDPRAKARRLLAALARRGFDPETAGEAVARALPEAADDPGA